jgi:hypothetical protein
MRACVVLSALLYLSCSAAEDSSLVLYEDPPELYFRALGAWRQGNWQACADLLDGLLTDGRLGRKNPYRYRALLLRGKALYMDGSAASCTEAAWVLEAALRERPSSSEAALWLARVYVGQAKVGAAGDLLSGLLEDCPGHTEALRLSASLAAGRQDAAGAMALLERAAAGKDELALVFLEKASLERAAGDRQGCLLDLGLALQLAGQESLLGRRIVQLQTLLGGNDEATR